MNLEDIAKHTNLSVSTVSRAINNKHGVNKKTKDAVINFISQSNDKRLLKKIKRETDFQSIAIITPSLTDMYLAEIIQLITVEANTKGLITCIYNSTGNIKKEIEIINQIKNRSTANGLILLSSSQKPDYPTLKNTLKDFNKPFILLHNEISGLNVSGIYINKMNLSYDITQKYIYESYREIAIIVGPSYSDSSINRIKGYKLAFEENNLKINEDFVVYSDWINSKIITDKCRILFTGKNKPKVVLCGNENIIINLISYCNLNNIVIGKDVQLASFHHNELFKKLGYDIPVFDAKLELMAKYAIEELYEQSINPDYTIKKIELIATV
jgi:DNA-binding LacI/PurR family transcriptional regulator